MSNSMNEISPSPTSNSTMDAADDTISSPSTDFAASLTPNTNVAANDTSPPPTIDHTTKSPSQAPIEIGSLRLNPGHMYQYKDMMKNVTEGSEKVLCSMCGEDGEIKDPTKLVDLDDGVTTCGALVDAGLSKVFTKTFCETEAKPLAESHCGCTREILEAGGALQVDALSSSSENHQVEQAQVNVGIDASSSTFSFSLSLAVVVIGWACTYN
jgi:hypothetical protein